jgi:RHS repeat-associated protein
MLVLCVVMAALTALMNWTAPPQPAAASTPDDRAAAARTQERPDETSALMTARLTGKRVRITGMTSQTSEFWALPDGRVEAKVFSEAVRVRRDGRWRPVDLTLRRNADGSISPVTHPQNLRMSGGTGAGVHELAAVGVGDRRVAMSWSGRLPEPSLSGTRATYREVLRGVDLVVEATRTGFEQFLVVKSRSAVPSVSRLNFGLSGKAVASYTQDAAGGVVLKDRSGRKIASVPAPEMWDARVSASTGEPARRTIVPTKTARRAAQPRTEGATGAAGGVDLTLSPQKAWLNASETVFPVTLDPQVNPVSTTFDTYVKEGDTVDRSGANDLQMGIASGKRARSFVDWNTEAFRGKQITSSTVHFWNWWSQSCTAYSWELWTTGAASSATRWENQPAWQYKEATSTQTKGYSSACDDGWVTISGTTFFQRAADANATQGHMGLRATSESDGNGWKQFRSRNAASSSQVPYAVVNYNSYPTVTGRATSPPAPCTTGSGRPYVNSATPQLKATVSDAETTTMSVTFEWWGVGGAAKIGSATPTGVASGGTATTTVPAGAMENGRDYMWRVRASDGTGSSPWSSWCEFTIDTTAPSAPAVSSTDYPANTWSKGAGQEGSFTFSTTAGDVNAYLYGLDTNPPTTSAGPPSPGGPVTVRLRPATNGPHTLYVRTQDRAGNVSSVTAYAFFVGSVAVTSPSEGERATRVVTLSAAGPESLSGARFQYRRSPMDAWADVPAGDVTNGGAAVAWPVGVTNGNTPALRWSVTQTLTEDGPVEVRAVLASASDSVTTEPVRFTVDRDADAAATEKIGPGSVNLMTGDFRTGATDAAYFGMNVTRTTSSRAPQQSPPGQVAAFGPQWGVDFASAGGFTTAWLRRSGRTVTVSSGSGAAITFSQQSADSWLPEVGAERFSLGHDAADDTFTLTESTTGATFSYAKASAAVPLWSVVRSATPGTGSAFTYVHETVTGADGSAQARLRRIVAPTTAVPGSTCAADPSVRGCRVLELVYATDTTAGTEAFGDCAGQVREIRLWAAEPGASGSSPEAVSAFAYDTQGRLSEAWDPRISPSLKTTYRYDSAGRVVTLTPPGELPWRLLYGNTGPAPIAGDGMLLSVSRASLAPGSATQTTGEARTTIVYDVPLEPVQGGPYDLSAGAVAAWGQQSAPSTGTAVFPADAVPTGNVGRGVLSSGSYRRATVHYLDRSGRAVDVASPGGSVSATDYDRFGHSVGVLTAGNRELALGLGTDASTRLAELGLSTQPTAQRAALLSSASVYSPDGLRRVQALGPLHLVTLDTALAAEGGLPALPAGTEIAARQHAVLTYDQGRPATAAVAHQLTRSATGAAVPGYSSDTDVRTTATEYDWQLGVVTKTITDPGGEAVTETVGYDAQGRVVERRMPDSNGEDAGTTAIRYYSATGEAPCGGRPEWADLECRSEPKAPITGAGSDSTELVTKTTTYTRLGAVATVTETANGQTRTTTTRYDQAGREVATEVTGGVGEPTPGTTTRYDSTTGRVTATVSDGGQLAAAGSLSDDGQRISKEYDLLGRMIAYTDAGGERTTYRYDILDRPQAVTDPVGITTYAYDTGLDPRGVVTSQTDSVAGTVSATYDSDGNLVRQGLPGGVTEKTAYDATGMPVVRSYSTSDASLLQDRIDVDVHGQWVEHSGLSEQTFTMDRLGRISSVDDTFDGVCTRRTYRFGANTNRVAKTTAAGAVGDPCPVDGGTTVTHTYDSADRIVDTGYGYDAFGRTATTPDGMSLDYYTGDRIRRQTVGDVRQTWALDPQQRFTESVVQTQSSGTWSTVATTENHYRGDGDSPDWIVEDPLTGALTRNIKGVDDRFIATTTASGGITLHLTGLHGDVNVVYDPTTAAVEVRESDEYGVAREGLAAGRYGWLGSRQRSRDAQNGTMLMGIRVYDPETGRFLQTDPLYGGNANAYDYCSGNPNSCADISGYEGCWWYNFCGRVYNWSGRNMRAGEIKSYSGGGCQIWDAVWTGRIWRNGRCSTVLVKPGYRLGGGWYDVDVFTFPARNYYLWGMWAPANRYAKISTGMSVWCVGGRGIWAPECF